ADPTSFAGQAEMESALIGQRVQSAFPLGACNDLRVAFANGATLESFADSGRFEHWQYTSDGALDIVAGPGTLWSMWPGEAPPKEDPLDPLRSQIGSLD